MTPFAMDQHPSNNARSTSRFKAIIHRFSSGNSAKQQGGPPPYTTGGAPQFPSQVPFGTIGYMGQQMPLPMLNGMGGDVRQAQLANQMLQMQLQMQQMQQVMQQMMAPSSPLEMPGSAQRNVVEMPAHGSSVLQNLVAPPQITPQNGQGVKTTATATQAAPHIVPGAIPAAPALPSKEVICSVCITTKKFIPPGQAGQSEFPRLNLTSNCNHDLLVCLECLASWIETRLNSKGWNAICCPQCPELLEHNVIQKFASREVFQRYEQLSTRAAMAALPNFRYCLARDCDSGQEHVPGDSNPKMICITCRFEMCYTCDTRWHDGETCNEYCNRKAQEARNDAASLKWIAVYTKPCPGCKIPTEPWGGCSQMCCSFCRTNWCRKCGLGEESHKAVRGRRFC